MFHLYLKELTVKPTITTISTYFVVMEFGQANGPTSSYAAEYALLPTLEYEMGNIVTAVDGQKTYVIRQDKLIPGSSYMLRIVPLVRITSWNTYEDYRGIPSPSIEVTISQPGNSDHILY